MSGKLILIVANEPDPEKEEDYNEWYSGMHIPMMFEYKGMKKASRYRRLGEDKEYSKYLAVYEFDNEEDLAGFSKSPEFAAAVKDFDGKWQDGGFKSKWAASYELLKSWDK